MNTIVIFEDVLSPFEGKYVPMQQKFYYQRFKFV